MSEAPTIRSLTLPESELVASVFGDTLDPLPVTIRHRKFWPLQPRRVTMAPDGHIWCHPDGDVWCRDFCDEPLSMRAHFIHEMTHVWQRQQGRNLYLSRMPWARYRYDLRPGKRFQTYGIEQQAMIVADAYRLREGQRRPDLPPLSAYAATLPFGDWTPRIA